MGKQSVWLQHQDTGARFPSSCSQQCEYQQHSFVVVLFPPVIETPSPDRRDTQRFSLHSELSIRRGQMQKLYLKLQTFEAFTLGKDGVGERKRAWMEAKTFRVYLEAEPCPVSVWPVSIPSEPHGVMTGLCQERLEHAWMLQNGFTHIVYRHLLNRGQKRASRSRTTLAFLIFFSAAAKALIL